MLNALAVDLEADDGARSLDVSIGRRRSGGDAAPSRRDVELLEDGEASGSIDTESVAVQDHGSEVSEDETFTPCISARSSCGGHERFDPSSSRRSGVVG